MGRGVTRDRVPYQNKAPELAAYTLSSSVTMLRLCICDMGCCGSDSCWYPFEPLKSWRCPGNKLTQAETT